MTFSHGTHNVLSIARHFTEARIATHSVQQPGGQGTSSGAFSDRPNQVPLQEFEELVKRLMDFDALAKRL